MQFWEGGINIPLFGKPNIEKMKQKQDVKGLCKALGHKDKEVKEQAVTALVEMRETAVEPVIKLLDKENLYGSAMEVLGKIGGAAVVPLLATLNNKKANSFVPERAVLVLGKIRDTRAVEHLIATLKDTNHLLRRYAAESLGLIGDTRAVEPLIAALSDESDVFLWDWQRYIIVALGRIGDKRAVEPIIYAVKKNLARTLDLGVQEIIPFSVLGVVAEVLGQIGDERAVELLIEILQIKPARLTGFSGDLWLSSQLTGKKLDSKALKRAQDMDSQSALAQNDHQNMRVAAVLALGKIGGAKAAEALMVLIGDASDPVVQGTAMQAWKSIRKRTG
jgi:HEAT repeat protein